MNLLNNQRKAAARRATVLICLSFVLALPMMAALGDIVGSAICTTQSASPCYGFVYAITH